MVHDNVKTGDYFAFGTLALWIFSRSISTNEWVMEWQSLFYRPSCPLTPGTAHQWFCRCGRIVHHGWWGPSRWSSWRLGTAVLAWQRRTRAVCLELCSGRGGSGWKKKKPPDTFLSLQYILYIPFHFKDTFVLFPFPWFLKFAFPPLIVWVLTGIWDITPKIPPTKEKKIKKLLPKVKTFRCVTDTKRRKGRARNGENLCKLNTRQKPFIYIKNFFFFETGFM